MEDVLEVYQRPYDPKRPQVCLDEASKQLIGETRLPVPAGPGREAREDYEYVRHGTVNLFMMSEPLTGRRHVRVTDRRTKKDFAETIKELVEERYPHAEKIVLVMDNLNTHSPASLYDTFEPSEARRLAEIFLIVLAGDGRQVHGLDHVQHEVNEIAVRKPVPGRRRQQIRLIRISRAIGLAHP